MGYNPQLVIRFQLHSVSIFCPIEAVFGDGIADYGGMKSGVRLRITGGTSEMTAKSCEWYRCRSDDRFWVKLLYNSIGNIHVCIRERCQYCYMYSF